LARKSTEGQEPEQRLSIPPRKLRAGVSAASGILSRHQKFFCKNVFHTKATAFMGRTIFEQVFVREGMSNFQNPKVPPTGGSHLPHAHPSSFEMRRTVLPRNGGRPNCRSAASVVELFCPALVSVKG
jgi:hypothetical protein